MQSKSTIRSTDWFGELWLQTLIVVIIYMTQFRITIPWTPYLENAQVLFASI